MIYHELHCKIRNNISTAYSGQYSNPRKDAYLLVLKEGDELEVGSTGG